MKPLISTSIPICWQRTGSGELWILALQRSLESERPVISQCTATKIGYASFLSSIPQPDARMIDQLKNTMNQLAKNTNTELAEFQVLSGYRISTGWLPIFLIRIWAMHGNQSYNFNKGYVDIRFLPRHKARVDVCRGFHSFPKIFRPVLPNRRVTRKTWELWFVSEARQASKHAWNFQPTIKWAASERQRLHWHSKPHFLSRSRREYTPSDTSQ